MKEWKIWAEGYQATGQASKACCLGAAQGETFENACENLAKADREFRSFFDRTTMSYWGCALFSSETQARKSFG